MTEAFDSCQNEIRERSHPGIGRLLAAFSRSMMISDISLDIRTKPLYFGIAARVRARADPPPDMTTNFRNQLSPIPAVRTVDLLRGVQLPLSPGPARPAFRNRLPLKTQLLRQTRHRSH